MTFLEAAFELLRQTGRPMSVRELVDRAIKLGLLSHQGRAPESTMQARLAQELRKGERGLLFEPKEGVFGLRQYDAPKTPAELEPEGVAVEAKPPHQKAPVVKEPAGEAVVTAKPEATTEAAPAADGEGGKRRRRRRGGRGRNKNKGAALRHPEEGTPEEAIAAERLAEEAEEAEEAEQAVETRSADDDADTEAPVGGALPPASGPPPPAPDLPVASEPLMVAPSLPVELERDRRMQPAALASIFEAPVVEGPAIDLDSFQAPSPRRYPRPVELPSEEALASEYADEMGQGAAPPVTGEVVDERTADEDRQLRPEIQANRDRDRRGRGHGQDRHQKRHGKDRRPEGQARNNETQRRDGRPARPGNAAATPAADVPRRQEPERPEAEAVKPPPRERERERDREREAPARTASDGAPTGLADIAANMLRALNDPRPVHVRQLAAMALKRKLATGEPEELWRAMKAALLADSRARQYAGLRPPVRNHGNGLFVLTVARLDDPLGAAEQALAARAEELRRATRDALARRLRGLSPAVFEQAAGVYLERAGFTGITRVKRAEETWYLAGDLVQGSLTSRVLIAARGGGGELGRRAVGELRAGVEAKGLDRGLLLAPALLGKEATEELDAPGAPIDVFASDALADEMIHAGVGVQRAAMPVAYLDLDFFADLAEQ